MSPSWLLGKICIYDKGGSEEAYSYTLESVSNLTSLQTFIILHYKSVEIPTLKPLSSCNRLKSVSLVGNLKDPSELHHLPDSITGSLSNLTALQLTDVYQAYKGNKMVCSENGFPSLQILRLQEFINLEELEVGEGAFPSLKQFQIVACLKLKKIPVQLAERVRPWLDDLNF